jgi:hypothetical protein
MVSEYQARAFRRAVRDVGGWQRRCLVRLLRWNARTAFGREYGFAGIGSVAEFQWRVPLCEYGDLLPYMDRIRDGEARVLTRDRVLRFEPTSGTSAAPKRIPYTRGLRREVGRAVAPWMADLFRAYPGLSGGSMYMALSPRFCGEEQGAIPVGFDEDTGYFGGMASRLAAGVMAVPPEVGGISDLEAFRYVTLLFLLARGDLCLLSVWNPTFLEWLLTPATTHAASLVRDLEAGTLSAPGEIPGPVAEALRRRLRPVPARARVVAAALEAAGPWRLLWPALAVISCWADGWAAEAVPRVRALFPHATIQPKGLLATEAVVTIPLESGPGRPPRPVLAAASHFYEFLDVDAGDVRLAQDLVEGRCYEVVVTTAGGLYRYRLGDRVAPEGRFGSAPVLRFLGRGDEVSDLRGEKLHETFVGEVLAELFAGAASRPSPCRLEAHCTGGPAKYELVLGIDVAGNGPPLPDRLDALLCGNPHYAYCRALGQLAPPRVRVVPSDATAPGPLSTAKHRALRAAPAPLPGPDGNPDVTAV